MPQSYERIHRSNLVAMGVLPLQFADGDSAEIHGITGEEKFDISELGEDMTPGQAVTVSVKNGDGKTGIFNRPAADSPWKSNITAMAGFCPM
ncbi:MAG: hypothetical protein R2875_10610 [Desulfobacterales bacterium]